MNNSNGVPFFRMFERVSKNGRTYLSGSLGDASFVAFGYSDLGVEIAAIHATLVSDLSVDKEPKP